MQPNFFMQKVSEEDCAQEPYHIGYKKLKNHQRKLPCTWSTSFSRHTPQPVGQEYRSTISARLTSKAYKHLKSHHDAIHVVDMEACARRNTSFLPVSQRLRHVLRHGSKRRPQSISFKNVTTPKRTRKQQLQLRIRRGPEEAEDAPWRNHSCCGCREGHSARGSSQRDTDIANKLGFTSKTQENWNTSRTAMSQKTRRPMLLPF